MDDWTTKHVVEDNNKEHIVLGRCVVWIAIYWLAQRDDVTLFGLQIADISRKGKSTCVSPQYKRNVKRDGVAAVYSWLL